MGIARRESLRTKKEFLNAAILELYGRKPMEEVNMSDSTGVNSLDLEVQDVNNMPIALKELSLLFTRLQPLRKRHGALWKAVYSIVS
jgi:hypothetical protein